MFKRLFATSAMLLALFSFNANAEFVHHDIYLDVSAADAGNLFGLEAGFSGVIGFIEFDTNNAEFDNIINPAVDPLFRVEIALGSFMFSEQDDIDYTSVNSYPVVQIDYPFTYASLMAGVIVFGADLIDFDGNEVMIDYDSDFGNNFFDAYDYNGKAIAGALSFVNSSVVSEPSVLALMVLSLMFFRRFRRQ